jgi:hypothetical protein
MQVASPFLQAAPVLQTVSAMQPALSCNLPHVLQVLSTLPPASSCKLTQQQAFLIAAAAKLGQ